MLFLGVFVHFIYLDLKIISLIKIRIDIFKISKFKPLLADFFNFTSAIVGKNHFYFSISLSLNLIIHKRILSAKKIVYSVKNFPLTHLFVYFLLIKFTLLWSLSYAAHSIYSFKYNYVSFLSSCYSSILRYGFYW